MTIPTKKETDIIYFVKFVSLAVESYERRREILKKYRLALEQKKVEYLRNKILNK